MGHTIIWKVLINLKDQCDLNQCLLSELAKCPFLYFPSFISWVYWYTNLPLGPSQWWLSFIIEAHSLSSRKNTSLDLIDVFSSTASLLSANNIKNRLLTLCVLLNPASFSSSVRTFHISHVSWHSYSSTFVLSVVQSCTPFIDESQNYISVYRNITFYTINRTHVNKIQLIL